MVYLVVDEWELSNCDNGANYYLFDSLDKAKTKLEEIVQEVRADLKDITVHCFRRWLASDLDRKGADAAVIQSIMGHSSFSTTQRHYLDKSIDKMYHAYNLLVS